MAEPNPRPPFPAYGGNLTAASAGYTPAAPGYGRPLTAAAPAYGRPLTAEGLVPIPALYGYPVHGSPGFANTGFYGAAPGHPYAARGLLPSTGTSDGSLRGQAYAPLGLLPTTGSSDGGSMLGHAYALLPSTGSSHGSLPGHAYDAAGLRNAAGIHGHSYAAPGQGHQLAVESQNLHHQSDMEPGRHGSAGLNPGARSYSAPVPDSRKDGRRGLNASAPSFYRAHLSEDAGGNHCYIDDSRGAPWCSLPGLHQIGPMTEWSSRILLAEAQVRPVWRHNCLEVFQEMNDLLVNMKGRIYIAIDLEYLAAASTKVAARPFSANQWYESLKDYVDNGTVVQLGIAFASEENTSEIVVYEINLRIDGSDETFHEEPRQFLLNNGHDLNKHRAGGILPEWVSAAVLRKLPFQTENVVWLAYHGDRDIAFILKLLEGGGSEVMLPSYLSSFLHQVNEKFPLYYDVKVLAQLVKEGYTGKLEKLAGDDFLGLARTGAGHHAGSDALLTLRCFAKIVEGHRVEAIAARRCLLSGIEELRLPITCYRHVTATDVNVVDVYNRNFDQEAVFIAQTIENNFKIIGVQIIAPQNLNLVDQDYNTVSGAVREVNRFELLLAFMNFDGNLAFGRAWKIFLQVHDKDDNRVSILRLAALFAACGCTHSTSSIWVTYGAEYVLACLLQAFISPGTLPISSAKYDIARASLFSNVHDVKALARLCTGLDVSSDVSETALRLGVTIDGSDAVTILRCFYSLRGKGNVNNQS